ncbi:MAG: ribonucleotide monophosphatase NagD (HAD superfamily), partial [Candidatus Marinamargulisbacteria bacterium]
GFYAELLDKQGAEVYWIGKPHLNYARMVSQILAKEHISVNTGICFFDDNIINVVALKKQLGITSCLITESGLHQGQDPPDKNSIDFAIPLLKFQ